MLIFGRGPLLLVSFVSIFKKIVTGLCKTTFTFIEDITITQHNAKSNHHYARLCILFKTILEIPQVIPDNARLPDTRCIKHEPILQNMNNGSMET